jgi:hypothetical protein
MLSRILNGRERYSKLHYIAETTGSGTKFKVPLERRDGRPLAPAV